MSTENNSMYIVASRDTTRYSIKVITSSEEEAYEVWNREYPEFKRTVTAVDEAILLVELFDLTAKDIQMLEDSKADIKVAAKNDTRIQRLVTDGDCLEYYEPDGSMNETTYVYIVHSDINENNIYAEFATEEEAIDYARRHKDELTYVDKVEVALDEDDDIIEEFDNITIWVYDEEDEFESEEEFNEFGIDFEDETPLSEGIKLRTREEQDEFFRLCNEIGLITIKDIESFKKEVGCTDENLLQALRDYRAELGPDFEIKEGIDFDKLVEELEENEDMVECKECFDLVAKESCTKGEHGYVCEKCSKTLTEDTADLRLYGVGDTDGDYFGQVRATSEEEAYSKACAIWPEREVRGYGLDKVHLTVWEEDEDELDPDLLAEDVREVKCKEYDVVSHSDDEKPVDCKMEKDPLEKPLTEETVEEETHAQYAKPEGNRVQAFNNALAYAKKNNCDYIYGYTNHAGKFFALEQPIKVKGDIPTAEKEFRNQYKNCKVVYVAYPDKAFLRETLYSFTPEEQAEYGIDEEGYSLDGFDTYVRCNWCGEVYPEFDCVFEANLGWLCPRCQDEIRSHGGPLTVVEEPSEEQIQATLEEAIPMTRDELMDKEGTDDVELINAGRPEEERVELIEE